VLGVAAVPEREADGEGAAPLDGGGGLEPLRSAAIVVGTAAPDVEAGPLELCEAARAVGAGRERAVGICRQEAAAREVGAAGGVADREVADVDADGVVVGVEGYIPVERA